MTNNEIIKFLQSKQIPQCGDKVYTADEEYEAYQRAIDALEQQPCERFEWGIDGKVYKITKAKDGKEICQQVCDDAISRQAVLDKAVYTETEEGWSGRTVDVKDIEALPPVTPTCEEREKGECPYYAG